MLAPPVPKGEAEARAAQERESGRRERQALAAEHAARLAELRRLLEEERGELEARVVAERTARLAAVCDLSTPPAPSLPWPGVRGHGGRLGSYFRTFFAFFLCIL